MADDTAQTGSEVQPYLDHIAAYDKAASKWQTSGKKIVKRYLDERSDMQANRLRYNILWANVETLKPAIYAKTPKPEVERRFLDKDPVGRVASEVLERCLDYYIGATPFGSTMRQARMDYLLVGRGIAWVRYEPKFKPMALQITDDSAIGDHAEDSEPAEELAWEEVLSDYVHWRDFGHNVARTWEEVDMVWRKVYMTRAAMKKRKFKDWLTIPLDYVDKDMKDAPDKAKKATIYELWDKSQRKVFWLSKNHQTFLDQRDDPLGLDRFFPCSEPVYATLANETLIPVPDFVEYQDQAQEIDELTARIGALQKAIKAAGVYDSSQDAVGRLLNEGVVNTLIPVASWAALNEKGGLKGTMELLPMQEIAETLLMLYEARDKVKQDLYEITGMSDIIRGATKATETATAQNIKNNYITMRLSEKQREMQRFARNTIEIMGNIICRHFSDETIIKVSGVQLLTNEQKQQLKQYQAMQGQPQQPGMPPLQPLPQEVLELLDEPSWDDVLALLKDEPDRCFRIDIETDSTIEMDAAQDRDEAMQFLTAVGGFIKQVEGIPPELASVAGSMLEFGVRKWRVGRTLEGVINKAVEDLEKKAAQPPQGPPPDPAMLKAQADIKLDQQRFGLEQQQQQFEQQRQQALDQHDQQMAQQQAQAENARAQNDAALDGQSAQAGMALEVLKAHLADQAAEHKAMMDAQMEQFKALLEARTKIEVAEITAGATLDAAQIAAANEGTADADV